MKYFNLNRILKSQENIQTSLNNKTKKKYSENKSISSKKCLTNKMKSETKLNKIYIKEMKVISNIIKNVGINSEKEIEDINKSNYSKKSNQIFSPHINSSNTIEKKNSATLDLISKIIEVNSESLLKNSPFDNNSNGNSLCQNDSNCSNKNLKLFSSSRDYPYPKTDKKKYYLPSSFKHDSNIEERQLSNSKIKKIKQKISQKSISENKNFNNTKSSNNLVIKNRRFSKLMPSERENNNNNTKKNDSQRSTERKKHTKNKYLKLRTKCRRNSKEDSAISLPEHNNDKNFSCFSDQGKNLLKNTIIHFGLSLISENKNYQQSGELNFEKNNKINDFKNSIIKNEINLTRLSNKRKETSNSILGLDIDIDKLKKEIYDYENTDITDAINRLPTMKFDNEKVTTNNEKNEEPEINNIKYIERDKTEKINILNKKIKLNKEIYRRLQRKKYVYDSLDDEEYDDEEENNFYFLPDSIFIYIIDFIIFVTSFIELFYFPIYLAESSFNIGFDTKDILFYFTDIIFIIDLVVGFFKAYYNFDEFLVKKNSLIIKNYVQNWFIFDFICSIPFFTISKSFKKQNLNNNHYNIHYFDYKGNNLDYLLALIKIIKIFKVLSSNVFFKQIKNRLKENNFINDWGSVFIYLILLISILNIGSSIFIFVARNSYPNWILDLSIDKKNFVYIYICSVFHLTTTMTTIGYGDIVPQSIAEKIFEIFSIIVGTCLYSWIITSASNYIKKMNEKYIKFEKKKEILDEIRVNYPLLDDCLYDRIYRHLYYGKSHKEVDENIILETLPYSIRNELLIQMYDPIINNFKLFQYFENSEFVIRTVSLLKPFVCSKGDILVNEGDFIEDIILNSSGILSLDVCIDLNKQKESIEEYLVKYNLGKTKNINSKNQDQEKNNINPSNIKYSFATENLNQINDNIYPSPDDINDDHFIYKKTKKIKNLKFIKILYIRRNESFGVVLMFLNEKSPLYIRVHSKKAELFLLRKTDVVSVSSDYPNIWYKATEKSIFNFEQIKNIITRKLTNFCNFYGIKTKLLCIKKDPKNCLYSCSNYLMSGSEYLEDDSRNQSYQSSAFSKRSQNINNISYDSQDRFESENNNKISIIKEESDEESNINNNFKMNKNSLSNLNPNIKDNKNKNYKNLSTFSRQSKKIENSSSSKEKNNSVSNQNNSESYITIISNNNSLSPFWSKTKFNSYFCPTMDNMGNSYNENDASPHKKKRRKKTKSTDCCIKKRFNKNLHISRSYPANRNKTYENIRSSNFESDKINDEIYSNEIFEIKLKEEDDELMSKNIKNISKVLSSKFTESDNKKNEKKVNNKFFDLKINSLPDLEIKSSYDNLNVYTNYKYIKDDNLRKRTKQFLGVECGFLSRLPSIYKNDKLLKRRTESKPTKKISKIIKTKQSLDSSSRFSRKNYRGSSYYKSDDMNSSFHPNESLFRNRSKNCDSLVKSGSFNIDKKINKSIQLKQTVSMQSKRNLRRAYKINSISNSSEEITKKKNTKKNDYSTDIIVKKRTKRKMDLISENMQKNRQNLNNPNEFYADLFNNFVVNNRQGNNGSAISNIPVIKITHYDEDS